MAMDIRPRSSHSISEDRETPPTLPNERNMRVIVGSILGVVVLLGIGAWYVLGAPGAPEAVKRTLGKLPSAGDRVITDLGNGLNLNGAIPNISQSQGLISGLECGDHAKRRPIAVMLASDPVNRPDSGFSQADAVVEMPALTSNVTRLMALFQCQEPRELGSVRSTRHDYLFLAAGFDAIITHWGGSYHALNRIKLEGNVYNSISALGSGNWAFYRKPGLPAPYNGFTSYDRVWEAVKKVGYRTYTVFAGYSHVDEAVAGQRGPGGTIDVSWPGSMRARFVYNAQANDYERYWGGVRDKDAGNGQLVSPKVVAVMYTNQRLADGPGGYNDVDVEGSGRAEIYQNGQKIDATWSKNELRKEDPLHFKDASGADIPFVRGQLWIAIVDATTPVRYTVGSQIPPDVSTGNTPTNLGG